MPSWDSYPPDYRASEITEILSAAQAGDCTSLVGLSGAGKSNLLGFLKHRVKSNLVLVSVDCNRLLKPTSEGLIKLIQHSISSTEIEVSEDLSSLETSLAKRLDSPAGSLLCLMFDRFDILNNPSYRSICSSLRYLRDSFKYRLTYITATRQPLDPGSEISELFYAHTLWLGPLHPGDARWSIKDYASRKKLGWEEPVVRKIMAISGGYPSFLRAVCEAYASGAALDAAVLRIHPAVQGRLQEFWADNPNPTDLRRSGLQDNPLLKEHPVDKWDTSGLTAKEMMLFEFLLAHPDQICEKDDLIQAVWPEDKVFEEGIRDDSLAQLIRRVRRKIEPDPANPRHIQVITGRGYRFHPESEQDG
ncbi:MAG: helix-turn-helix domain-containing protein [Anaerolineaceae bacterium]|nr:helix-turn-helix domain-containing protein [Anaerolineaceae bacterium]